MGLEEFSSLGDEYHQSYLEDRSIDVYDTGKYYDLAAILSIRGEMTNPGEVYRVIRPPDNRAPARGT
jgi:hypothetical protein